MTITYAIIVNRVEGAGVLEQSPVQRTASAQTLQEPRLQDLEPQPLRLTWLEHSRRKEEMESKPISEIISRTQPHGYKTITVICFRASGISPLSSPLNLVQVCLVNQVLLGPIKFYGILINYNCQLDTLNYWMRGRDS